MEDKTGRRKILITQKDLKGLHKLSRSLIRDLQELRKDPRLNRKDEIVHQLDEALQTARETKETLRELYIRDSIWSKQNVSSKSTQTSKKKEAPSGPHSKQWDRVGQMVNQLNRTVSYGSGRLDVPLINESVSHRYHEWWCEQSNQHLVPTIRHWLDLWASERDAQTTELQKLKESESRVKKKSTEAEEMVAHFQKLFDVPTRDGVFTRLNDVYNRLGELMNVLHVLKDILGLDKDEPTSRVVSVVNKLCDLHSGSSTNLLRYLLQADDLDRMVLRIDAYNKFFPVFERVAKELMDILEVDSLTHLIPAVKALKLLQP
ncbi:uncharacterized protein [Apostichopus japonicus]|uniref:uncharacterized protein isoform X2 n=1 Tax=Stichopus japonicus TaxID=307972 RepID=UPI003AB13905